MSFTLTTKQFKAQAEEVFRRTTVHSVEVEAVLVESDDGRVVHHTPTGLMHVTIRGSYWVTRRKPTPTKKGKTR